MSTPYEYDPSKANAWTRDLPPKPPIKERPEWITIRGNRYGKTLLRDLEAIQAAARAVIAAGRPHDYVVRECPCNDACLKCQAWEALRALLEP